MATINRTQLQDLRGAARLAFDATSGITALVEKMHHTIQLTPLPLGKSKANVTRGITGLVYRSVRGATHLIRHGVDASLAPLVALLPEGETNATRDTWVSVVNGVYGDHLERTENPLAIGMHLRAGDRRLDPMNPSEVLPDAGARVMVMVHGLCLNESNWAREGKNPIASLAESQGYTPVYLRYNSGRAIASNGRDFAALLETLVAHWPQPVQELAIVGHSMGGLVARSAEHHARSSGHDWPARLRKLVFLGTPLHGAPLERGGHRLDYLMELSPYVAPFTRIGKSRSSGITDLRYGNVTSSEREFVPLPEGVACYALAANLGERRDMLSEKLIGDGLVPLDSALGRHADASRTLAIPPERQWIGHKMGHLELLHRREVYTQLRKWLRAAD